MAIDFHEFEEVRAQFFNSADITSVTFSHKHIRFSSNCVRKLNGVEHIELSLNPLDGLLAVQPCSADNKDAMRWTTMRNDKTYGRPINGAAFLDTIYDLFEWEPDLKYRLRGEIISPDGEHIILFDANEPEIIIPNAIIAKYTHDESIYITSQTKRFTTALPTHWQNSFGDLYNNRTHLHDITISNKISLYNTQPELQPTALDIVGKNIRQLLTEMQRK